MADTSYDINLEDRRFLRLRSGYNVRELGGFATLTGLTRYHRFVRCGSTRSMTDDDLQRLCDWGVTRVVDLRSFGESPQMTCRFAKRDGILWSNVPLYDIDLSAPAMTPVRDVGSFFVAGYLNMLASHLSMRRLFAFLSEATPQECVLFHCAAGNDRTGVVSMLLLGLAGVSRRQIVADYGYSFGTIDEVDAALDTYGNPIAGATESYQLFTRMNALACVYDTVVSEHGSIRAYLESCEIPGGKLDAVRDHLLLP